MSSDYCRWAWLSFAVLALEGVHSDPLEESYLRQFSSHAPCYGGAPRRWGSRDISDAELFNISGFIPRRKILAVAVLFCFIAHSRI